MIWDEWSWRFHPPALLVTLGIEFGERRETAAGCGERNGLVRVRHDFWHDAPRAVWKLLDAPELFRRAGEGGQYDEFGVGCGGECAVGAGDGDLKIRRAGIAASVGRGCDRPLL